MTYESALIFMIIKPIYRLDQWLILLKSEICQKNGIAFSFRPKLLPLKVEKSSEVSNEICFYVLSCVGRIGR